MDFKTVFLRRIDAFVAHYGMSESAFGFWAVNDRKILCRIAEGGVTLKTVERIDAAMTRRIGKDNLTWEAVLSSREVDKSTGREADNLTGGISPEAEKVKASPPPGGGNSEILRADEYGRGVGRTP